MDNHRPSSPMPDFPIVDIDNRFRTIIAKHQTNIVADITKRNKTHENISLDNRNNKNPTRGLSRTHVLLSGREGSSSFTSGIRRVLLYKIR
jgi:hypothetical protein